MGAQGLVLRRRIFLRLREGLAYDEIAREEGVTSERIRQIVSEVLQKRSVDSGADHAKLQLARLAPVMPDRTHLGHNLGLFEPHAWVGDSERSAHHGDSGRGRGWRSDRAHLGHNLALSEAHVCVGDSKR
jgi:hypothetical protein